MQLETGEIQLAHRVGMAAVLKMIFECASPELFAYRCQWKVLHCEGSADAAFTCDGVREPSAHKPRNESDSSAQEGEKKNLARDDSNHNVGVYLWITLEYK